MGTKTGPAKRSIPQDINKASRVPLATVKESLVDQIDDIMTKNSANPEKAKTTKKRRAEPSAGEENATGEQKQQPKKPKTTAGPKPKKGLVPLKGQMKMTAFMRRL